MSSTVVVPVAETAAVAVLASEKSACVAYSIVAVPEMAFAAPPKGWTRFRLWLYGCSLRFQMLLNCRRPEKHARLERRWRTVRCRW